MQDARRVSVNIFDQRGRRIAAVADGIIPAGRHEAVWDAKGVPARRLCVQGGNGRRGGMDRKNNHWEIIAVLKKVGIG